MIRRVPEAEAISEPEQSGSPAGTVEGKRICEKIFGTEYEDPSAGVNGKSGQKMFWQPEWYRDIHVVPGYGTAFLFKPVAFGKEDSMMIRRRRKTYVSKLHKLYSDRNEKGKK